MHVFNRVTIGCHPTTTTTNHLLTPQRIKTAMNPSPSECVKGQDQAWPPDEAPQSTARVPAGFKRLCLRLGMAPQAPDAWASMHINPETPFLICLLVLGLEVVGISPIYILASRPFRWLYHSIAVSWTVLITLGTAWMWRCGPSSWPWQIAYMPLCVLALACLHLAAVLMVFGPEEQCLFQDRLKFAFLDALALWLISMGARFGGWPPDYPSKPYRCPTRCFAVLSDAAFSDLITNKHPKRIESFHLKR